MVCYKHFHVRPCTIMPYSMGLSFLDKYATAQNILYVTIFGIHGHQLPASSVPTNSKLSEPWLETWQHQHMATSKFNYKYPIEQIRENPSKLHSPVAVCTYLGILQLSSGFLSYIYNKRDYF